MYFRNSLDFRLATTERSFLEVMTKSNNDPPLRPWHLLAAIATLKI